MVFIYCGKLGGTGIENALELIGNMGLQLSEVYINRFITAAEVGPTGADQLTALLRLYVVDLDGVAALATF